MIDYRTCKLELPRPEFDSALLSSIVRLEQLKAKKIVGSVHPHIFFQIKDIFHLLESIGSSRIEGNNTTIAEYIDSTEEKKTPSESVLEIKNAEQALSFIERYLISDGGRIDKSLLLEMHRQVVGGLSPNKEGDSRPGQYRNVPVQINKSAHVPPPPTMVDELMTELIEFIQLEVGEQYSLLKTAIVHHRFAWIHPFRNGNGRVVRLLTYAMLISQGFNIHKAGRIINPTAVFCNERAKYYEMLAAADSYENTGQLQWCEYFISGLEHETKKLDMLLEDGFIESKIVKPALDFCHHRNIISDREMKLLGIFADNLSAEVKSEHLKKALPDVVARSRGLKELHDRGLIQKISPRKYTLSISRGPLIRGVIDSLHTENFLRGIE